MTLEQDGFEPGPSRVRLSKLKAAAPVAAVSGSKPDTKGKAPAVDTHADPATIANAIDSDTETTFSSLGVSSSLISSLASLSITTPTAIQRLTIPAILRNKRDVIGGAQTGSGKTLCFALPILQSLSRDLVCGFALVPTRELAVQLHEQFVALSASSATGSSSNNARIALVVGGVDQLAQAIQLSREKPHVIVATPGRIVDLLRSNAADLQRLLERCRYVVLDEADRLLTQSFAPQLKFLFDEALPPPERRQTLLFTATVTEAIDALIEKQTKEAEANVPSNASNGYNTSSSSKKKEPPLVFQINQNTKTPETLIQKYILVPSHMREPHLFHLLRHSPAAKKHQSDLFADEFEEDDSDSQEDQGINIASEAEENELATGYDSEDEVAVSKLLRSSPTIIFVNKSYTCELLSRTLTQLGIPNVPLHSLLPQSQRFANLESFRAHRVPLLISTDVGSRGLDLPDVQMVVQFDLPAHWEDYVHRVGRTARAGRSGWAVSFVTERDVELVQSIEEKIGVQLVELKGFTSDVNGKIKKHKTAEETIMDRLNKVMTAKRTAKLELQDENFGEARIRQRNKRQAEQQPQSTKKSSKKSKR